MAIQKLHIISHAHWDREWYLSFSEFRYRLVKLIDSLIECMETDPTYRYYWLDGQTVALEDYLEVRPEMEGRLRALIEEGRILIGPWYVLQDEFLEGEEASVRNLYYGIKTAEKYGKASRIGYLPDTFGHIAQLPQILRGFGIDNAFFGRGIKAVGKNNAVLEPGQGSSENIWASPDGSEVLGVLFVNWYNNAYGIPTELEAAEEKLKAVVKAMEGVNMTSYALGMNGCDHTPIEPKVGQMIEQCRNLPFKAVHSTPQQYLQDVRKELAAKKIALPRVEGELTNQHTNGYDTLSNTASTRMYIKRMNFDCEHRLVWEAEPLAALCVRLGLPSDTGLLEFFWKTLLKNHAHDSICGCSNDKVNRDIVTRFEDVLLPSAMFVRDMMRSVAEKIDTSGCGGKAIVVFHTSPAGGKQWTEVEVLYKVGENVPASVAVFDKDREIPCAEIARESRKEYELPYDSFREVYDVTAVRLRCLFESDGFGYKVYCVAESKAETSGRVNADDRSMSNGIVSVRFHSDGTYTLLDLRTGKTFESLQYFADESDIGDEYMYRPTGCMADTRGGEADISLLRCDGFCAEMRIAHTLKIPKDRNGGESFLKIETIAILNEGAPYIEFKTKIINEASDHRVRVMFPTKLETQNEKVLTQYCFEERPIRPGKKWQNPSNSRRTSGCVALEDATGGLLLAGRGIYEYEANEKDSLLSFILLRCVGEIGDWFYFPTPRAQCHGENYAEFAVFPYAPGEAEKTLCLADDYRNPKFMCVQSDPHPGSLPSENVSAKVRFEAPALVSAVKPCFAEKGIAVRMWSPVRGAALFAERDCCLSRLDETHLSAVSGNIPIEPAKVVTVLLPETKNEKAQ